MLKKVYKSIADKLVLILLCTAIVAASFAMLWRHYTNTRVLTSSDLIYKIESRILDFKFRLRGVQPPTGQIGILAVDEKTITKFGDWPFSRTYYGRALRNLKKLGVKFVGFDANYPEPQATKLTDLRETMRNLERASSVTRNKAMLQQEMQRLNNWLKESPGDLEFAKGIGETGNVVLGYFSMNSVAEAKVSLGSNKSTYFNGLAEMESSAVMFDLPEGRTLESFPTLTQAFAIKTNLGIIQQASDKFAFFSNNADDDAINRWVTLLLNINGNLYPSLALKVAAEHLNRSIVAFFNDLGVESISLIKRDDESDSLDIPVDPFGAGRILLNHRGPANSFKHYSLSDAYYNTFTKKERAELNGMSLLLGGTATGTQDQRPNPFDPSIDGVENHAAAIDNVIRGDVLRRNRLDYENEKNIVLAIGLIAAPFMIWGSSIWSGLAVLSFLFGYWFYDWKFWFGHGIWAYVAVPSCEIIILFMVTTFYKYMVEEREKRVVKGAFQHYLSPAVIDQLLDDPSNMSLGGVRKEITVFFSDVRGFTTISESLSPEKLCEFMNEYFTPMTAIVLQSAGTLDKYIGDAIMAFWGAPLTMQDHAARGARASIQMLFALDKLREDMPKHGFPKPDIGIGLNSAMASVGNMGSHARFSYTAMGDGVNLASRLEGLTKDYGIKILISEFTAKLLDPNEFLYRDLDDIRVKGKNEPVKVFELMRPDKLPQTSSIRNLIGEFSEARIAYTAQDWKKAEKHLQSCLIIAPDDAPTELYMKRVQEYMVNSPGEKWDGVYNFKHK